MDVTPTANKKFSLFVAQIPDRFSIYGTAVKSSATDTEKALMIQWAFFQFI